MLNSTITSSPAPAFPAAIRYIQDGDSVNTGTCKNNADDTAQALGHLKGSMVHLTETNPVVLSDLTMSGTNKVKLASRSITRQLALLADTTSGNWSRRNTPRGSWHNTALGGSLDVHLERLPHGQELTAVAIRWEPTGGHIGLPNLPTIELFRIDNAGGETSLGSQVDTSASVVAYETNHSITLSLSHTIDLVLYRYVLVVVGETGGDFVANAKITGLSATCTCTNMPEF